MNPVLPKHYGSTREDAWRGEFPRKHARHFKGRRTPERFSYDYPPVKIARVHSGDSLRESSFSRPPSLLDSTFPNPATFNNLTRRQQSPKMRDGPYETRNRVSLESWRIANEPLPVRRSETSGAWVKPAGRLTSAIVDSSQKSGNQRAKQIASALPSKGIQGSSLVSQEDDSVLSSNLISARKNVHDDYDEEEERLARIRNDLERMKHEDKEGYELLLKVLAGTKDSGGTTQSVEVEKEPVDDDNFTAKQSFIHRPDYEMKVEGGRKFQEKSDHPKPSRSPSALASNPLRNVVGANESEKKPIPLLSTPISASAQLRWESWRNLSSAKRETSFRSPWKDLPPPSDSWRTSTVSPMASSWRSVNKTDYGSSSVSLGEPSESSRRSGRSLDFIGGQGAVGELGKKPTSFACEKFESSNTKIPYRHQLI